MQSISHFIGFFLLIAFVLTCCITLFLHTMQVSGIVYTRENISLAAKMTFANVLWLSLLCTGLDTIRRRVMIGKPIKQIVEATEKVVQGDFSVRINVPRLTVPEPASR